MRRADTRTSGDGDKRNADDSGPMKKLIESYFRKVGMDADLDGKVFQERLSAKHGRIADRIADAISAREEGEDVDVYVLKNNTLALSIDVTAQYCRRMYEAFLVWFLRARFPKPQSLLDVGCDNGILTCFYATVYPDTKVVGVDRCEQGIGCARELAERLNLANVRFVTRDLLNLDSLFPNQSFDLIVSTAVFHEVLEVPEELPEISIDPIPIGPDESHSVKIVTGLSHLLPEETGRWLSMERWPDASSLAWWIRVLNQAGLRVSADQSTLLTFCTMDGEQEALPILVATRQRHPTVDSGEPMLALRIYPHDPVMM